MKFILLLTTIFLSQGAFAARGGIAGNGGNAVAGAFVQRFQNLIADLQIQYGNQQKITINTQSNGHSEAVEIDLGKLRDSISKIKVIATDETLIDSDLNTEVDAINKCATVSTIQVSEERWAKVTDPDLLTLHEYLGANCFDDRRWEISTQILSHGYKTTTPAGGSDEDIVYARRLAMLDSLARQAPALAEEAKMQYAEISMGMDLGEIRKLDCPLDVETVETEPCHFTYENGLYQTTIVVDKIATPYLPDNQATDYRWSVSGVAYASGLVAPLKPAIAISDVKSIRAAAVKYFAPPGEETNFDKNLSDASCSSTDDDGKLYSDGYTHCDLSVDTGYSPDDIELIYEVKNGVITKFISASYTPGC